MVGQEPWKYDRYRSYHPELPLSDIVFDGSAFHRSPQMTSRGLRQSSQSGRLISESANHSINTSISYDQIVQNWQQ